MANSVRLVSIQSPNSQLSICRHVASEHRFCPALKSARQVDWSRDMLFVGASRPYSTAYLAMLSDEIVTDPDYFPSFELDIPEQCNVRFTKPN
jgi:hypothetical protein